MIKITEAVVEWIDMQNVFIEYSEKEVEYFLRLVYGIDTNWGMYLWMHT